LVIPTTRHARAVYISSGQAQIMPELLERVRIAVARLTPHLPEDEVFSASETLARIAIDGDFHGSPQADYHAGSEFVHRLPEAELPLCRLIENTDSIAALEAA